MSPPPRHARPAASPASRRRSPREISEAIVEAGHAVLRTSGWEGLTVSEVARRADVSIGTFYARFADKDDLIVALNDAFVERLPTAATNAFATLAPTLPDQVRKSVVRHVALMTHERELMRAFMRRTAVDERLLASASESTRRLSELFRTDLLAHSDAIGRPQPELAADVCFRMVHDVVARRVLRGSTFESDIEFSWERLTDELTRLCTEYLTTSTSPLAVRD